MKKMGSKIGYAIMAGVDTSHPAYRRRFGFYLAQRKFDWEIADPKKHYDLVVVHHSADLPRWAAYQKGKLIVDYNDDYLATDMSSWKAKGRGIAKYIARQWSSCHLDFREGYLQVMRRADAVVCSTDSQMRDAAKHCRVVAKIVDMQSDLGWESKQSYSRGESCNVVWEGLPDFKGLSSIAHVIQEIQNQSSHALHIITSIRQPRVLNRFVSVASDRVIHRQVPVPRAYLYQWNAYLYSKITTACDFAIIPINMADPYWVGKPANKLLFFWRLGMPVLVSPTPEYELAMLECGTPELLCRNDAEWRDGFERLSGDASLRARAGRAGLRFAELNYSNDVLLSKWDSLLERIL